MAGTCTGALFLPDGAFFLPTTFSSARGAKFVDGVSSPSAGTGMASTGTSISSADASALLASSSFSSAASTPLP
ncbi:hypothetical protein GN244_ATG06879 [Phytophthora infestans]|uniref:Uncharacterized protein n=1 Tax=Phytophthora infestans TaxID=4787 RepID=A0A833WGD2_PHYIN|nr:hypothetical protein GN244_ATG06879 [Phytophthora infestans]